MVRHLVLWKLKEDPENGKTKQENAAQIKQSLEALVGVIPGVLALEVGLNQTDRNRDFDLCLVSLFESFEALSAYQTHPAHRAVQGFVHSVVCGRTAADYEVDGI